MSSSSRSSPSRSASQCIDPDQRRSSPRDIGESCHQMRIRLVNTSVWKAVKSDNFGVGDATRWGFADRRRRT